MNNSTECMVCCEKYNKQLRTQVVCNIGSCGFNSCKSCCRHYLMNCNEDIHCMSCRKAWDNKFVILNLNRSWFINTYTPRKVELLFELNKARAQEVMPRVELVMERKRRTILMQPQLTELNKQYVVQHDQKSVFLVEYHSLGVDEDNRHRDYNRHYHSLTKQEQKEKKCSLDDARKIYLKKKDNIRRNYIIKSSPFRQAMNEITIIIAGITRYIRTGENNTTEGNKKEKKEKVFIMPCQNEECSGFLSSSYKCGLCDEQCCKSCFEMLGTESDMENKEKHECNKDQVETAKLIKQTTKPCPQCGQRIHKISGCDQMWCIECKCPFSWTSGEIITRGVVHNPHYFQYLRANTNGEIARQPGDNPCDNIRETLYWINRKAKQLITMGTIKNPDPINIKDEYRINECELQQLQRCDILTSLIRRIYHVENVDLVDIRQKIENSQVYEGDLVSYLAKDLSESDYKKILRMKWREHKKQVDKLYLADVFVNVGKDIINTIFFKLEKRGVATDDFDKILHDSITELNNFITYYNEQYTIISISHNMVGKKIQCTDYTNSAFVDMVNSAHNIMGHITTVAQLRAAGDHIGHVRDNSVRVKVYYTSYKIDEKTISCKISDVKNK